MPTTTSWGSTATYLTGTYEEDLQPWIESIVAKKPSMVVDIGAADGYYAVGLARRLPGAVVYAFDIDPTAQRVLRRTVRLNGVKNVRVRGRLDTRALQDLLVHGAFVFSDCEGFEIELLDPIKVPMLRTATLIVELHDMIDPRCSSTINRWFRESHLVTIIDEAPKTARGRAQLDHLSPAEAEAAVDEERPADVAPNQWAIMTPRV